MHGRFEETAMRSTRMNARGDGGIAFPPAPVTPATLAAAQQTQTPPAPRGIKVRLINQGDREAARALLRQHHANTVFRDQPFSDWKFERHFNTACSRPPRMVGMVAESEGNLCGIAWAMADSYMLSDGPLFVTVQLIAVELENIGPIKRAKVFLAMVSGIRQWAQSMNASHSFVHVTTGSNLESTDRLMKAAGAQCIGGAYVI
jgi:hypothetical protein